MNLNLIAENIIKHNKFLSLATSNGIVCWNAPLYYVRNNKNEFYFISDNRSVHARNIEENPYVAVTIFNSQDKPEVVNGVQFDGLCRRVKINELPKAIKCIYKEKYSSLLKDRFVNYIDPDSYLTLTQFRIYKIIPLHMYILDPDFAKEDKRIEVRI